MLSVAALLSTFAHSYVIILNGVTSSGKTSVARAIAKLSPQPTLMFGIDQITETIEPSQQTNFYRFTAPKTGEVAVTCWHPTPLGKHLYNKTLPSVVCAFATDNIFNIVVDEIFLPEEHERLRSYAQQLSGLTVYFVGLACALEELEQREHLRGDRPTGHAQTQYKRVHAWQSFYDPQIDSGTNSPDECAQKILAFIERTPHPDGFTQCRTQLSKN